MNKTAASIASGAMVLGLAGLFSRLLGVYRDRLLATTFGAGQYLDAYYAAFRIPDFVFNLLVLGALSAGFIPLFSEYLSKNESKAWKLAESVFFLLLVTLGFLSLFLFFTAQWIIPLITPGFEPELMQTTIGLTKIMLLSPVLLGMSAVFGGVLQTYKKFLAYSLAPIFYNLGIIASLFFFIEPFGINGLAWGVVLGAFLHLLMQLIVAQKTGWRWSFKDVWQKEGLKEIIKLMGPRTASLVILQLNLLVITIFASKFATGTISIFNFANNLAHVPVGLFGVSFAVAAFPVLSKSIVQEKFDEFTSTLYKTFSQILFFLVPALILILLLDEQIIRLVYGAGEFDWSSTLLTAKTLLYFIPGIFAQTILPLLARAFYARKDVHHPLYASLFGFIATFLFAWILPPIFENEAVIGLALAYSFGSVIQLVMLWYWLQIHDKKDGYLLVTAIHLSLGATAMIITMQVMKVITGPYLDLLTVKGVLLHFLLPAGIAGAAYLFVLKYVENSEYLYYEKVLKGRVALFQKVFIPIVGTGEEDDTTL